MGSHARKGAEVSADLPDDLWLLEAQIAAGEKRRQAELDAAVLAERERVFGIIEAEMNAAPVSYPGVWQAVNNIISRIRSGAVAEPKEGM
jgi:hypothetical protein